MNRSNKVDEFGWEYLPCVKIKMNWPSEDIIVCIEDAFSIVRGGQGLVNGEYNDFFAIDNEIVSIYQDHPGGKISKKPVARIPMKIFKSITSDIESSRH